MRNATTALALALALTSGCFDSDEDDPRLDLVELSCDDDGDCLGRWEGTELWTPVHPIDELLEFPQVEGADLWDCVDELPDPEFVFCVEVDSHQRVGCFRDEDDWVVPVAPSCAVEGFEGWLEVGVGMSSLAKTQAEWAASYPD